MIPLITRYKIAIPFLLLSAIYLSTLDNFWKPAWDSAIYISLGKSIAAGNGYHYMGLPHAKYPFILPLILSPVIGLFGLNFLLMRLIIIICAVGSLYLTYLLFKKFTDEGTALSILCLTGFSYTLLHASTWILSEVPYLFFSLCALYSMTSYSEERKWLTQTGLISSLLVVTAIFTRMIGISLFIAFIGHTLLSRNLKMPFAFTLKKTLFMSALILLPLCLWFYRGYCINKNIPFQPEYRGVLSYEREFFLKEPDSTHSETPSLEDLVRRIINNTGIYIRGITAIIIEKAPFKQVRPFIALLFLYGYCWCFIKRRTVLEYYLCFYLVICSLWWFNQQPQRFLTPVIPLIFYYFLIGLKRSMDLLLKAAVNGTKDKVAMIKRAAGGMVVLLLILANFPLTPTAIRNERRQQFHPPALLSEFLSAMHWINEHTAQGSLIMSNRAPWVFMLTDRRTLAYPLFEPLQNVVDSIGKNHIDYIIISPIHPETYNLLHDFIESHPEQFLDVFRNNTTSIYKVVHANVAISTDTTFKN
jgi:4-amino-4-deoxy-L-arabinose transferase-like glycosyltransferase